jgi:hypothetical protein
MLKVAWALPHDDYHELIATSKIYTSAPTTLFPKYQL